MSTFSIQDTVGDVVRMRPSLARLFETARIDYCCGGKKPLAEVCQAKGLDPQAFLEMLEEAASSDDGKDVVDAESMSLTALADHIEITHHAFLRNELPRIKALAEKVASVHGAEDSRLHDVRDAFCTLAGEMACHMMKEEQVLFPMIRHLDVSDSLPAFHCGSIANPIRQMELEHHGTGSALERIRTLTDEYAPPSWACNTYRAMLDSLAHLERDMHVHIHKEDSILYPRALNREATLTAGSCA